MTKDFMSVIVVSGMFGLVFPRLGFFCLVLGVFLTYLQHSP